MKTKKISLIVSFALMCVFAAVLAAIGTNGTTARADANYTITFHYTDENYSETSVSEDFPAGTIVSEDMKYVPCALGYYFIGWDKDGESVTGDTDLYAVYALSETTDDAHTVTYNDDGSITLYNGVASPEFESGALLKTYNCYTDFELSFTISDNNTTYSQSRGPMLYFGDWLKYFLASGKESSGEKRTEVQAQPMTGAMIQQRPHTNGTEVIAGWFNAPMETAVKITVLNGAFRILIDDGSGNFIVPNWWSHDDTYNDGFVSLHGFDTTGTIGFGFVAGSTGSYTLSDISVKNLDGKSDLLSRTLSYNVASQGAFEAAVSGESGIQSVWLGNSPLSEDEYTAAVDNDGVRLRIENSVMRDYIKYAANDRLRLCVYSESGAYDAAEIAINGFVACTVRLFDGETLLSEQQAVAGKSFVLPALPESSVGWYVGGKRINKSVIYPSGDLDITAKYPTDEFNVELKYRNLRFKEKTENIKVAYGTVFTDETFPLDEPYGYVFAGWDYYGAVIEDMTVTAKYSLYSKAKGFSLDFDGIPENLNYIEYVSSFGNTDLSDNYMYVTGAAIGSGIYTNQK
ncbi:MAG: hypothetical protein IJU84_05490, partial [Clostridia bacterium]|nr:hypothetical protein [Clostridia bacterium]